MIQKLYFSLKELIKSPLNEKLLATTAKQLKSIFEFLEVQKLKILYYSGRDKSGIKLIFSNTASEKEFLALNSIHHSVWIQKEFKKFEDAFDVDIDIKKASIKLEENEIKLFIPYTKPEDLKSLTEKLEIIQSLVNIILTEFEDKKQLQQTNKKFMKIYNTLNDGVCCLDVEGTIEMVNQALLDMTGYTREELIGKSGLYIHHPIDHPKIKETLRKRAKGLEESSAYNAHLLTKNGKILDVFVSGVIQRNSKGEPDGSCGIFLDLSKVSKVEKKVKESRDFLENLMESMSEGVISFKTDGQIQYINSVSRKMLGLTATTINEPNSFLELLKDDYDQEFFYDIQKKLMNRDKIVLELDMKRTDGSIIPVQITFSLTQNVNQESDVNYIFGVMRDLSKGIKFIEQIKNFRDHLIKAGDVCISIVRFGNTGAEIVYTDPLYFTEDKAVILQSAAIYFSALGQSKLEKGVQTWSKGTFGPLPVPKHNNESLVIHFGTLKSDRQSDSRFKFNEPYLILFIFPNTAETIFNREDVDNAILKTLKEENITAFNDFRKTNFVGTLRKRVIASDIGLKSIIKQDKLLL